jgi:hypothetical protein
VQNARDVGKKTEHRVKIITTSRAGGLHAIHFFELDGYYKKASLA